MKGRFSCWLAPAAFGLDRVTKLWAQRALPPGVRVSAIPGLLRFLYVENTGAAFSLLTGRSGLLLVVTGFAIALAVVYLLVKGRRLALLPRMALWLLVGGAAGNFLDRAVYGAVIDFLELAFIRFPVFNVADCCVSLAFVLLVIAILRDGKEPEQHA